MEVTCEIVGEGTETLTIAEDATYGDLVERLDYSRHEVTVLVDETPVPEDAPVETDHVRVLRLIKGG